MQPKIFYFDKSSKRIGPVKSSELIDLVKKGIILPDTIITIDGGRHRAKKLRQLKEIFIENKELEPPKPAPPNVEPLEPPAEIQPTPSYEDETPTFPSETSSEFGEPRTGFNEADFGTNIGDYPSQEPHDSPMGTIDGNTIKQPPTPLKVDSNFNWSNTPDESSHVHSHGGSGKQSPIPAPDTPLNLDYSDFETKSRNAFWILNLLYKIHIIPGLCIFGLASIAGLALPFHSVITAIVRMVTKGLLFHSAWDFFTFFMALLLQGVLAIPWFFMLRQEWSAFRQILGTKPNPAYRRWKNVGKTIIFYVVTLAFAFLVIGTGAFALSYAETHWTGKISSRLPWAIASCILTGFYVSFWMVALSQNTQDTFAKSFPLWIVPAGAVAGLFAFALGLAEGGVVTTSTIVAILNLARGAQLLVYAFVLLPIKLFYDIVSSLLWSHRANVNCDRRLGWKE